MYKLLTAQTLIPTKYDETLDMYSVITGPYLNRAAHETYTRKKNKKVCCYNTA